MVLVVGWVCTEIANLKETGYVFKLEFWWTSFTFTDFH